MNIYTFNFIGHYPVGASGLVVAENIEMAKILAEQELLKIGLKQELKNDDLKFQDNTTRRVDILQDGDY